MIKRIAPEIRFGWRGTRLSLVRQVLTFSSSLFLSDAAARLQTKTDEIVIGIFLLVNAVTPYALARRLSEIGQLLTEQFLKVLLPLASELNASNDPLRLRWLYIASTRMTLAIFLPIGAILIVLARQVLTVWVGAAYADYADLVVILTISSLISTSQWPAGSILQGMGRPWLLAIAGLCSGLVNLGLSIVLVRPFGITGVALGTLIPTTVECLGFVLPFTLRVMGVRPLQALREILIPALLPAVPMVVSLYALQQAIEPSSLFTLAMVSSIGLFVYLIGYFSIADNTIERQICRDMAFRTVHFAKAHLKRP
jgi:O-antigen/teichoic acid export membrane protein